MLLVRSPAAADGRLEVGAGIVVALELRAEREPERVINFDFILQEGTRQPVCSIWVNERRRAATDSAAGLDAGVSAPHDVVPVTGRKMILEVEVGSGKALMEPVH